VLGGAGYPPRPGTASDKLSGHDCPEVRAPYLAEVRVRQMRFLLGDGPAHATQTRCIPAQIAGVGFTFRRRVPEGVSARATYLVRQVATPSHGPSGVRHTPVSREASPSALPVAAV
jgi:hypothetical protein